MLPAFSDGLLLVRSAPEDCSCRHPTEAMRLVAAGQIKRYRRDREIESTAKTIATVRRSQVPCLLAQCDQAQLALPPCGQKRDLPLG